MSRRQKFIFNDDKNILNINNIDCMDPLPAAAHVHTYVAGTNDMGETSYVCSECGYTYSE